MAQAANISNVQLWAKADLDPGYTSLDLYPEEPIKLTLSVTNITDPLSTTSIFSRTFRVPNTQANNAFFKAVFNVNSVSFDASKKVSAYLNDNGSFYTNGNIRLLATYQNDRDGNVDYEIVFMGETSDFASQIGGGFLSALNLTQYNHDRTFQNITNSWNPGGIFNGDILYPLINWGYTYSEGLPVQNTTALYTGVTGGLSGFTDSSKPLSQAQMKPSIRAKALWDAIFDTTEYTYDSEFLESNFFKSMYIISEKQARPELDISLTFEAKNNTTQTWYYQSTPSQLYAPTEVSDPNGSWNPANSIYTAQATSGTNYNFVVEYKHKVSPFSIFSPAIMTYPLQLVDADTGAILASVMQLTVSSASLGIPATTTMNVALTQGQRVKFMVDPTPTTPFNGSASLDIFELTIRQTAGPQIVTMTSVMPDNIRQIDFMRSIINRFRLVFVPSTDNEKHFTITPWKDWILEGTSYDWNPFLDTNKDIKSTPLFYGQNRFQVYSDQEDSDFPNYTYQLSYKQTYGQLNLDSDNELLTGTITVKDQFAPTPIFPIGGAVPGSTGTTLQIRQGLAAEFLIPWISKADFTAVQNNPIQPKLRLVFYNGLQYVPGTGTPNALTWYLRNDSGTAIAQPYYPLVSEYSYWPVTDSTFDLSWTNTAPLYNTELTDNPIARTSYDTFNVYWKTWSDTNFDPYSRKVELTLILDYIQMLDLKFNNYYWIKDSWYFINKVTDYIAGQKTSCKVELIKVGNEIGLTIPPTVGLGYSQPLCYVPEGTFCDAYCCAQESLTGVYYSNALLLVSSNQLFQDKFQTIPANEGIYANADGIVFSIGPGGFITEFFDGASCEPCGERVLYAFPNCCRGSSVCQSCCCDGPIVNLWGDANRLESSTNVYTNSAGTTVPVNGWYKDPTNPAITVYIVNGLVWQIGLCATCVCDEVIVYERDAVYSSPLVDDCDACTDSKQPTTVWIDSPSWSTATKVYETASDNQPVNAGFWRATEDGVTYKTLDDGTITEAVDCSACESIYFYTAENCSEPGLLENFSSNAPIRIGQVVSSSLFTGQCWTIIAEAEYGYPIDVIHDGCRSCQETWICNCVEYRVYTNQRFPSYISYKECAEGRVQYLTIEGGTDYSVCMCEGTFNEVEGSTFAEPIGTCVTPPCYVWDITVTDDNLGIITYEECTTGVTKTLEIEPGAVYQVCAVDLSIVVVEGAVDYVQGVLCG